MENKEINSEPLSLRVSSVAFAWSTEDLDQQARRLYEAMSIDEETYNNLRNLSTKAKWELLDSIINGAEDYLIGHINEIICDGIYDHVNSLS